MTHWTRGAALGACVALCLGACSIDWPAYRHNLFRSGNQLNRTPLADPARVPSLAVRWSWQVPANPQAFRASPVVESGRVYIGNGNGYFYALDANTGAVLWQYPATGAGLTSSLVCNPSSHGIASSAAMATVKVPWFWFFKKKVRVVIFGAPDPSIPPGLGSGRLFALKAATGAVVWKSDPVAQVTGTTWGSTTELHEQIGYSAPLVVGHRVYIGVANHCDNPIQKGRLVAADLQTGALVPGFTFTATGTPGDTTRGGGLWSSAASDLNGIYVTTGNVRCWNGGCQAQPAPNHGLSMLRLDPATGAVIWKLQPVPFAQDDDPDWSAGAAVMLAGCGTLVASVQKDGWAYAVNAGTGTPGMPSVRWQFPPTGIPFPVIPGVSHGDTDYKKPGAAWGNVLFIVTGGYARVLDGASAGYGKLHALNACAPESSRVRWILDVPNSSGGGYSLGPPSVTGGIVYIGTDLGHLVAIADPSVAPAAGVRCANTHYTVAQCGAANYPPVSIPTVLKDTALTGGIWTEPALADGRVFVATDAGRVYSLSP
jgi:outer membrane protein assembly factor BamB